MTDVALRAAELSLVASLNHDMPGAVAGSWAGLDRELGGPVIVLYADESFFNVCFWIKKNAISDDCCRIRVSQTLKF